MSNSLVLALWQLDRHLRYIKDSNNDWVDPISMVGQEYLDAVDASDLKDLRDVMQHTDEYVAGHGRFPDHAPEPMHKWGYGGGGENFHLTYLGTRYEPLLYRRHEAYWGR